MARLAREEIRTEYWKGKRRDVLHVLLSSFINKVVKVFLNVFTKPFCKRSIFEAKKI